MMAVIRTARMSSSSLELGASLDEVRNGTRQRGFFNARELWFLSQNGGSPFIISSMAAAAAAPFSGSQSSVSIPLNNQITTLPTSISHRREARVIPAEIGKGAQGSAGGVTVTGTLSLAMGSSNSSLLASSTLTAAQVSCLSFAWLPRGHCPREKHVPGPKKPVLRGQNHARPSTLHNGSKLRGGSAVQQRTPPPFFSCLLDGPSLLSKKPKDCGQLCCYKPKLSTQVPVHVNLFPTRRHAFSFRKDER